MTGAQKLARYSRNKTTRLAAGIAAAIDAGTPKAISNKEPYKAFEFSKTDTRYLDFYIRFPDPSVALPNALIVNIRGEWRMGLGITITYANGVVVDIVGERLGELIKAVKAWKVDWIAEFDPESHEQPADQKAPFVKSIAVITERPEEPPPANRRH